MHRVFMFFKANEFTHIVIIMIVVYTVNAMHKHDIYRYFLILLENAGILVKISCGHLSMRLLEYSL